MLQEYENMTTYLHFGEDPSIWFSSHEEIGIFFVCKVCPQSIPSKFVYTST